MTPPSSPLSVTPDRGVDGETFTGYYTDMSTPRLTATGKGRGYRWTSDEDSLLREHYPNEGVSDALRANLGRVNHAIECRVQRLGLHYIGPGRNKRWTDEELDVLKTRYPLEGASKELCSSLGRPRNSIVGKSRSLGLRVPHEVRRRIQRNGVKLGKANAHFTGYEEITSHMICLIRKDAQKRDISHPLLDNSSESNEYLWGLYIAQDKRCALSGIPIGFGHKRVIERVEKTASLDRIDSNVGYTRGNVQWVHKHVNVMKRAISQEEFIQLANQIAKKHPRP